MKYNKGGCLKNERMLRGWILPFNDILPKEVFQEWKRETEMGRER